MSFFPHCGRDHFIDMKKLILTLAVLVIAAGSLDAQDRKPQYGEIAPAFKCHFRKNKKGVCRKFPNLAIKLNLCKPDPEVIGTIEWCRKEYTKTEIDECGKPVTYDAVDVTYRYVYCNGAWGHCFTRTYRDSPLIIEPPILAKGIVSK